MNENKDPTTGLPFGGIYAATDKCAKETMPAGRPPVGLRPEWIADYHHCRDRLIEIAEAMTRYSEAGKPVPLEWCLELDRRISDYVPPRRERAPNAAPHER